MEREKQQSLKLASRAMKLAKRASTGVGLTNGDAVGMTRSATCLTEAAREFAEGHARSAVQRLFAASKCAERNVSKEHIAFAREVMELAWAIGEVFLTTHQRRSIFGK